MARKARGHIRQRSKNHPDRWTIYIYVGVDRVTGKKRYMTEVFRGTRREAEARLTQLLAQMDRGEKVDPSREPLAKFLERWLRDYAEVRVRRNSVEIYRGCLERYVVPALGHIRVDQLTPLDVQSLQSGLLRRGLSAQTVFQCHQVFSQALRWGVKTEAIGRNVADLVDPPRVPRFRGRALDWGEVRTLLTSLASSKYHDLVLLTLLTGMRRAEVLPLRWRDVDLDAGSLSVSRALVELRNGEFLFGPTKSGLSRVVQLPSQAVDCLGWVRDRAAGLGFSGPDDLVFCQEDGGPIQPKIVSDSFRRIATGAGLKGFRFHDLRHTHASLLLLEGVHVKVVSERLGHAGVGITLNRYSHLLQGIQEAAAVKLSEKFGQEMGAEPPEDLQKDLQGG